MWWRRYFPVEIKKDKQWWSDVEKEKRKSLSYKEIYSNKYNFPVLKICEQKRDWLMNGKYKYSLSIVHKILKKETAGNQEFVQSLQDYSVGEGHIIGNQDYSA